LKNWIKCVHIFPRKQSVQLRCASEGTHRLIDREILQDLAQMDYLCEPPEEHLNDLKRVERALGYTFGDKRLLYKALIHSSYINENQRDGIRHNERIEYLGDAVLSLILSEYLFRRYPERWEGDLSLMRSWLVSESSLASVARRIGLPEYIYLGNGEAGTGGRERSALHADALEALIGSIYLDGGCGEAARVVLNLFKEKLDKVDAEKERINSKNTLQYRLHAQYHADPEYQVVRTSGPDHMKKFEVVVQFDGKVLGHGEGYSKKEAEMNAASCALETLS
jgi:ribonuclease-3